MKEGTRSGTSVSDRALFEENGGKTSLLRTPKIMLNKALEMSV